MDLAKKLNSLRKEAGLSQSALAEQMDVARQTVSRWESGEVVPTLDNLRRLSELYGVSIGYLMNDDAQLPGTAVAVAEKPEPKKPWRKPVLIGIAIGLVIAAVIALLATAYFTGYSNGTKDVTPSYVVHTDVINEEDIEGTVELRPLYLPSEETETPPMETVNAASSTGGSHNG